MKLYVNGNLEAYRNNATNCFPPTPVPFYQFRVARHGGGGTGFFPGIVDEVRIYTRVLSDKEIKALYEATK